MTDNQTPMHHESSKPRGLADHILPSSATMIGVCMTVISVSQLIPKQNISKHVDEMLALDAVLFLASAMLSYFSIRNPRHVDILERRADLVFLVAITVMVVIGFVVSFELLIN
jgi:hypothetical protein